MRRGPSSRSCTWVVNGEGWRRQWLKHPRRWLGAQWAGLSPWEWLTLTLTLTLIQVRAEREEAAYRAAPRFR